VTTETKRRSCSWTGHAAYMSASLFCDDMTEAWNSPQNDPADIHGQQLLCPVSLVFEHAYGIPYRDTRPARQILMARFEQRKKREVRCVPVQAEVALPSIVNRY